MAVQLFLFKHFLSFGSVLLPSLLNQACHLKIFANRGEKKDLLSGFPINSLVHLSDDEMLLIASVLTSLNSLRPVQRLLSLVIPRQIRLIRHYFAIMNFCFLF